MTTLEILGQISGFIALVFAVWAYQMKESRKTMLLFAPTDFFYGLQYLFLGSLSSFLVMLVAVVRDLFGVFGSDRYLRYFIVLYILIVWGVAGFSAELWPEYLAPLATSLATIAALKRDNFYWFRILLFLHHIAWMIFNIWITSYVGIILICFTGTANITGFLRHRKSEKEPVDL